MGERANRWFRGDRFWLNKILHVKLEEDNDLLTPHERREIQEARLAAEEDPLQEARFELPISDERSGLDDRINSDVLSLRDLNGAELDHDQLMSVLLTTFDMPDPNGGIAWIKNELRLDRSVEVTLCSHPWPGRATRRATVWQQFVAEFDDVVWHFPGEPQLSQPKDDTDDTAEPAEPENGTCTVHAKLILLEFHSRLRVVITSANLLASHWEMMNEVVWVQDFPRTTGPNLYRLLEAEFGCDLSHFLAQTLDAAPKQRRAAWHSRLADFDLQSNAHLVLSLPGKHEPAIALQPGQLALRLSVFEASKKLPEAELELSTLSGSAWLKKEQGTWRLYDSEGKTCLCLDEISQKALFAAENLNMKTDLFVPLAQTDIQIVTTLLPEDVDWNSPPELLLRLKLSYKRQDLKDLEGSWTQTDLVEFFAILLSQLEVDYGLFALRRHLNEVWAQAEEEDYVAITSSVSALDETWFRALDQCCGRFAQDAGPKVVVRDTPSIEYSWLHAWQDRLVQHRSPSHSPGREKIPNHSKLITRIFKDKSTEKHYGWVYVGSHNLTCAAWGTISRNEEEILWSNNRELGILLQAPSAAARAAAPAAAQNASVSAGFDISEMPWPFSFPLHRAELEEGDFQAESAENQDYHWSWWNSDDWYWCWTSSSWVRGNSDENWQNWEVDSVTEGQGDWRLQPKYSWWWTA